MSSDDIILESGVESSNSLSIRSEAIRERDNCLAFQLKGSIDSFSSEYLRRHVVKEINAGFAELVFFLQDVNYISSTGVGTFLVLLRMVVEKGGSISLVKMQPQVLSIFQMMCLDNFFCCTDSLDKALGHMPVDKVGAVFPSKFSCPNCAKRLVATKAGRFRCSACKSVLVVDERGEVLRIHDNLSNSQTSSSAS